MFNSRLDLAEKERLDSCLNLSPIVYLEVSVGYDPTSRFIIRLQFSRLVQLFHFCQLTLGFSMLINNIFNCTQEEFDNFKSRDLINLICTQCKNNYQRSKKNVLDTFKRYDIYPKYCSSQCLANFKKSTKNIKTFCTNCNKEIVKLSNQYYKSDNHFCSRSCTAIHRNKNKTHGTKRSKLEIYLEEQLTELYPNLEILYSDKKIIGSELDIYIPSLKLAFEIQGIFHYEPIFGQEKLDQIQKNDLEKIQKCKELDIKLHHIDISKLTKCTEKNCEIYNQEVLNILESALSS